MQKISLAEKLALFEDSCNPRVIAQLNGQEVKVVKLKGEFIWHHHEREDELFLVVRGRLEMRFRDRTVELGPGELIVVPHGVEHCPVSPEGCEVVLFEPAATINTGNAVHATLTRHTLEHV
jgi:mannose-6-phosphate isomerase-like protein (cupin superfamily)